MSDKVISPFYGAFVISWLAWNWKVWYLTFFVDSNLLLRNKDILKIDYILNVYGGSNLWHLIYGLGHLIILPFLSAWFFIYIFPKITCKFYEKSIENENINKLIRLKKEKELSQAEEIQFKAKRAKLEEEEKFLEKKKAIKQIKSEKSQEEKWDEEFEEFKRTKYFLNFATIKRSYYDTDRWASDIPSDIKAYCDSNGVIEMVDHGNSSKISLTNKGKYFMKRYLAEKG